MGKISIGSLGGTIAMIPGPQGGGVTPRLTAQDLLASIPDFNHQDEVYAEALSQLPSASLTFEGILAALDWGKRQIASGARGVILTQGTDTLEETAFLLDLFWHEEAPLILTGAMRSAGAAGADGPANLLAALQVARDRTSWGRGVMVVMNDTIHAARRVAKSDALAAQTFRSPNGGPIGRVIERLGYFYAPPPPRKFLSTPIRTDHHVALISCALGSGPELIHHAASSGRYAGIIVAAYGAGHVSQEEAEEIGRHTGSLPIIIASRTGSGRTASATYGYPGSEMDLAARGAWLAGWLSPVKARILLWSLIAARPRGEWKQLFGDWANGF